MIYLIYGNQSPTIKSQIKKITASFLGDQIDDFNFVKIDGMNNTVQDAVDECRYVSLGYDKKVVSLENAYFLLKPKPKNKIDPDQNFDELNKYLSQENDDNVAFIISVNSSSVDLKSDLFSLLKEKSKIIEISDPDEKSFLEYIKSYCEKYQIKIERDAINELANRTGEDVALFKNSITKLTLYTDHIRYADVVKMVTRKLEDNAFLISNYLIDGRNMEAVNLFRDLRTANVEPVVLISQIATQFRLINQVKYLYRKKHMGQEEIAKELKIKPGRVYVLTKTMSLISTEALSRALEDLYKLDCEIKSGQVDRYFAFELFLINFKRD